MISPGSLDNEEGGPAMALGLSQLPSDVLEERAARLRPKISVSSENASRPTTPRSGGKDNLALVSNAPQRTPDFCEKQVTESHPSKPAPASNEAHLTAPPDEHRENGVDLTPMSSERPANMLDEQAGEPKQRRGSRTAAGKTVILRLWDDPRGALDGLLSSGLIGGASGQVLQDDDSEILKLGTIEQGTLMVQQYEISGALADLEEGINALKDGNEYLPQDHPMKAGCLTNLGNAFLRRFEHLGNVNDLEQSITAQRLAVRLTPDDHPRKPAYLNNLGNSLQSRFERLGDPVDLDESISAQQKAVRLAPDGHPQKSMYLNNLGISFLRQFECLGNVANLDEAITSQQQAVLLTADGHPNKPMYLNSLGVSFHDRFKCLGNLIDLDAAITIQKQAVRLAPDGHPNKPGYLNNLGSSFRSQFGRLGNLADLNEAIMTQQQAVRLTSDGHPSGPGRLNNLGNSFQSRFERLGNLVDLEEAITAKRQAVDLTPDGHPDKPGYLNDIGYSFQSQFEHQGNLLNLDEAITAKRQAVRLTSDSHPDKPMYLNNLGISLRSRFERLADLSDLDGAITVGEQAVCLTHNDHPDKPMNLGNLGISLFRRFEHKGNLVDLDDAITAQQQAVCLDPDDHPHKPMHLNNLGISFLRRFERLSQRVDLDQAITVQQQAVYLTPDGHPDNPLYLNNLGTSFLRRSEHLENLVDVEEAIAAQTRAVRLTPDGHPNKPGRLNNLGDSLQARLKHQLDEATLAQAISTYSQSAQSTSGPPSLRFAAAHKWATLCFLVYSNETLDAYSALVDLLPRVVWLGRTIEQRFKDIPRISNAMGDAVATAIHFGKLDLALEWMEQGRSVVWGQLLQLRTPLDELNKHHPDEANGLEKISRDLASAGIAYPEHSERPTDTTSQSLEERAQSHRRLAEEYDRKLAHIRHLPGFTEFLRPTKSVSLCGSAISGSVVVVNVHKARCDALILHPHSSEVSHVPLPRLQVSALLEMQEMQLQLGWLTRGDPIPRDYAPYSEMVTELSDILGMLWSYMAEPILSYLDLLRRPTGGELPHITWCLTGPLTFLPVHAAGLYNTKDQPKIFHYVVSSYTPTLTALMSAGRRHPKRSQAIRLLTISQPATPGQGHLPGTLDEVDAIQTLQTQTTRLHITRLDDQEATVAAVLRYMEECSWIHLACHGVQDAANPADSAFILSDKPLTLREIMKQTFTHTELAVLSACKTAKGDSKLPEEAIHLAAGMLMAGYGSVVATMRSIDDDDAPIVADRFYRYLIQEAGGDSSRAAYALHHAVAHLREVRGENNFASWVPFIHLGICSPSRPLPE